MSKFGNSLARRAVTALDRPKFFRIILALLILQAAWIALSGRYPMAFDEDFHLGIIRLYAHHLSPFWSGQPENADRFGAVARDPSYLYQYLMSFPYRLITLFTRDQTIIVLVLRFINIGLFAGGLALFRKLLLKAGASRTLAHLCLLAFVLVPIVPLLASQISYDNLFLPVVALALLLALRFDAILTKRKRLDAKTLLQLLLVCLLASLVKYVFLPIFASIAGFVAVRSWQRRKSVGSLPASLSASWRSINRWWRLALVTGLVVAGGLFFQRIGINLVRYHVPVPDCGKVLSVEQCREYGPWIRDYNFAIAKIPGPRSPITYTKEWLYGMWLRTFFTVGGPATDFQSRGPLVVPALAGIVLTIIGIAAFIFGAKRLFKRYCPSVIWLFLAVTASYVGSLWLDDFRAYLKTGQPVAVNGRYLLPVLLPVLLLAVGALAGLTKRRPRLQLVLAVMSIVCLAWGGGALTFILRSNDNWYWPNRTVLTANHLVQRTIGPLTPGFSNPTLFLR